MIDGFDLDAVTIKDEYYMEAMRADINFIKKFDKDRVLAGFRKTAGIDTKGAKVYQGWEDSLIGGHCLGHYLTAAAQAVKLTDDSLLKSNLEYIICGLRECQEKLGNGFLSAATVEDTQNVYRQFDIEEGKTEGKTWVPWYALHKVLQGILDVYLLTENELALNVAGNLADWVAERVKGWDEATRNRILKTEYGGMNDVLYRMYQITKEIRYKEAAEKFDDLELYGRLIDETYTLHGIHANTTIPKFIGAVSRVMAVKQVEKRCSAKEKDYLLYAEKFWQRLVDNHAYITGGISDMEHFRMDGRLDASRTQCNCESCCAHNMLKFSKGLFQITGKEKYADYYERTLRNAVMGAINPRTGATTYFSPMATGYYKVFSEPEPADSMMWCCTGTGMENYTKLGDAVYFKDGDTLYINQYLASEVLWEERNILLKQYADIELDDKANFVIEFVGTEQVKEAVFKFRKPGWVKGDVTVVVSGMEATDYCVEEGKDGYFRVKGMWRHGAVITVGLPMAVEAVGLPDCENVLGFRYGATVLAAKLGKRKMEEQTWAGIDLCAPAWKFVGGSGVKMDIAYAQTKTGILETELLTLNPGITLMEFQQNIHEYLLKREGQAGVEFVLKDTDAEKILGYELVFVPYNRITDERYGIYWYFNA